ncbi:MAG: MFS transporter, partial [Pseudomonadota bacterium]
MVSFVTYLPLLASVVLLQLSSGAVGPLDALSGVQLGYTPAQIGLLGSAHFLGFFIGCWWTPRLTGQVGHARAFAALTAAGAMGLLAHMMWTNPYAWALMRVATGMCVAGCYTVIEAWLQGRLTNETRGKAMGAYRVVDLVAGLAGQAMIGVLSPASYVSYNLLAIICCASLIPLAITTSTPPTTAKALKLRPMLAWTRSPLAVAGVVVSGVSGAAFRMVGPLYGQAQGLSAELLGLFLAAFVAGGALAQFPIGWLADRFDRRRVLIALSLLSLLASAGVALVA